VALAMRVSRSNDSKTYSARPHSETLASHAALYQATATDEPDMVWRLVARALGCWSVVRMIADSGRFGEWTHSPAICSECIAFAGPDTTVATRSDLFYDRTRISGICKHTSEVQETTPVTGQLEAARELPTYPMAEFIRPTAFAWDEDFRVAEEAARAYLKNSHADH
jgi:hypothetical protein